MVLHAKRVKRSTNSKSTRTTATYRCGKKRWMHWLCSVAESATEDDLKMANISRESMLAVIREDVWEEWSCASEEEKKTDKWVTEFCYRHIDARADQREAPLHIDRMTPQLFNAYVSSRTTSSGRARGGSGVPVGGDGGEDERFTSASQVKSDRDSFLDWYDSTGIERPKPVDLKLKSIMGAVQRTIAQERVKSGKALTPGVKPFPVDTYRRISVECWAATNRQPPGKGAAKAGQAGQFFEAQAFSVVTWNLMCRSSNTLEVAFPHCYAEEDRVVVMFAKAKVCSSTNDCVFPSAPTAAPTTRRTIRPAPNASACPAACTQTR